MNINDLIGKTFEQAFALCKGHNYIIRITKEDNINCAITTDFQFNRVNVEIEKGIITKCDIG